MCGFASFFFSHKLSESTKATDNLHHKHLMTVVALVEEIEERFKSKGRQGKGKAEMRKKISKVWSGREGNRWAWRKHFMMQECVMTRLRGTKETSIHPKRELVCSTVTYRIQSKCSGKPLLSTHSETGENRRDYICKGKNNTMMKKYIYLLPRAVKLQNIMRSERR